MYVNEPCDSLTGARLQWQVGALGEESITQNLGLASVPKHPRSRICQSKSSKAPAGRAGLQGACHLGLCIKKYGGAKVGVTGHPLGLLTEVSLFSADFCLCDPMRSSSHPPCTVAGLARW